MLKIEKNLSVIQILPNWELHIYCILISSSNAKHFIWEKRILEYIIGIKRYGCNAAVYFGELH